MDSNVCLHGGPSFAKVITIWQKWCRFTKMGKAILLVLLKNVFFKERKNS